MAVTDDKDDYDYARLIERAGKKLAEGVPFNEPGRGRLLAALEFFSDAETTPDAVWFGDFFELSGDHMILTDEGWAPGSAKGDYEPDDTIEEVNIPREGPADGR